MNAATCQDVELLLATVGHESPDGEEQRRADEHLAECPACRRRAESFYRQDRALAELAAVRLAESLAERIVRQLQSPAVRKPTMPWKRYGAVWVVAACLLLAVSLVALRRSTPGEADMVRLERFLGEVVQVGADDAPLASGALLPPGTTLQTIGDESLAVLSFADGTRLELGADTKVVLAETDAATGKRVVLEEGYLSADVVKQPNGRPMLLATPHAELVVLGTRFQLAGGSAVTYVETDEGLVQVTRKSDGRSVAVGRGFETSVSDRGELSATSVLTEWLFPRANYMSFGSACFLSDGRSIVAAPFHAGDVRAWQVADKQPLWSLSAHRKRTVAVTVSPDGRTLATASLDGTVKLWDVATRKLRTELEIGSPWIADLAFSAGGTALAVMAGEEGDEHRKVTVWDVAKRAPRFAPWQTPVQRWAFDAAGARLATYDRIAKRVRLWNLADGALVGEYRSPVGNNVFSMAFAHDGLSLAFDGSSGLVTICDPAGGRVLRQFERRGGRIFGMTFSHDGRTLATGHQDGTVRLWDVDTLRQTAATRGPASTHAGALAFSSDDQLLLTREVRLPPHVSRNTAVHVCDVPATTPFNP